MEADPPFYPGQFRTTAPRAYRRSLAEGRLTDDDRRLIEEYLSERQATRQIGNQRVLKMRYHLITWRRFIARPYAELTIGDVYAGLNALQTGASRRGKPFKQNSKHDYIVVLKSFVLWLIANDYSTIPTAKIRDIRVPAVDHNTTRPEALLTPDEINRLLTGCRSVRDRAIVAVLYESGARVGEVARLRWRDVEFDKYGVRIYIHDTKENQVRYARCTWAREMLAAWQSVYPAPVTPDAWVFLSSRKEAMNYDQIRQRVKMAADRADLGKRVHLHLFRKSRATHMIQRNFQESVIKKMLWGNLNTSMFETYVVLSEADIDAEVLGKAGIETREPEPDPLARTATPSARRSPGSARPAARRSRSRLGRSWRARRTSSGGTRRRSSRSRRRFSGVGRGQPRRRRRPPGSRPDGDRFCRPSRGRTTGNVTRGAWQHPDPLIELAAEVRARLDRAAARGLRAPFSGSPGAPAQPGPARAGTARPPAWWRGWRGPA